MEEAGMKEGGKRAENADARAPGSHRRADAAAAASRQRFARMRHASSAFLLSAALCAAVAWSRQQPERGGRTLDVLAQQTADDFVRVTIPPNAHAGEMLQVQVAGRREREVQVPEGARPGEVLSFAIPEQASSLPLSQGAAPALQEALPAPKAPAAAPPAPPAAQIESKLQGTTAGKFKGEFWQIQGAAAEHLDKIPDLVTLGEPVTTHETGAIDFDAKALEGIGLTEHFAAHWTGEIEVKTAGAYTFYDNSDDGSKVYVNDVLVVDNDGLNGPEEEKSGTLELEEGRHPVAVDFFEKDGGANIHIKYSGPDTGGEAILLQPAPAAGPPAPQDGDDFGPLIGAIKKVMAAAASKDPDAEAEAQDALKDSVEGIVAIKIEQAKQKDEEKKAADEEEEKAAEAKEKEEEDAAKAAEAKEEDAEQKTEDRAKSEKAAKEAAEEEKSAANAEEKNAAKEEEKIAKEASEEKSEADKEKNEEEAAAAAAERDNKAAEGQLDKDEVEADSAAEKAESDEEKAKKLTGEEEKIAEDVDESEAAAKKAEEAASSEAAAEAEEVKSARDDAAAEKTAEDMANSAADKAVAAKDQAQQTAAKEAQAAKKNLVEAEEKAAADLAEENAVLDAARETYAKAKEEAEAAAGSEDSAERSIKELQGEEDRALSEASKAEDGAESERDSAENERDSAETERFDAEDAATRSSVAEVKAADERDEARMERERAEKAAHDAYAYTAGIGSSAAESRIESEIESYKDSEERAIESNEKELKTAIEKAQEHIRRAQAKINRRDRQTKDTTEDEVRKVRDMVKDLKSEFDRAGTKTTQYPAAAPYGSVWPYAGVYGEPWGRGYRSGRWKDKAIFLQRELNDLQAERGLYERQLAVTAANIGLIRTGKVPTRMSVPATRSTFGWFAGTRPLASAAVPSVPFAGQAVPVMPAVPLPLPATADYPQAYSVATSTPPAFMSVEEPLQAKRPAQGTKLMAAASGPPQRTDLASVLATQEASMLAARGSAAAAQAQMQREQEIGVQRQAPQGLHQFRLGQPQMLTNSGHDTQIVELRPSHSYTMNV